MRIFVTGGSGFVGGHLIEALAPHHQVLAMARSDRSEAVVQGFGATAVRCSLDDVNVEHLQGVDVVVHAAASVEEFGPREHYEAANIGGTSRMLDAARAAGVKRFVHVSTNATVFDGAGQLGVDEAAPYTSLARFHYGQTKAAAEALVLEANAPGFTTLAVRPCFVWGPRDNSVQPALVRMVEEGNFVWIGGGRARVSTTHVHELVHAIECALTRGVGGHAYFVADDDDTTIHGFLSDLASGAGVELPARSVPAWMVRTVAALAETAWTVLGRDGLPPVTRMAAWLMSSDMTVRTDRARAELGWAPQLTRAEAVRDLAV